MFAKFGKINVVNRIKTKAGGNSLQICFESAESAEAALSAKPKAVTLGEQVLNVSRPLDTKDLNERTVAVGLLGASTSKEQVTEHFKKCGEVEAVNFSNNRQTPTAYVRFVSLDSVAKALDLNGSQLNSRYITVREGNDKKKTLRSPDLTLLLTNTGAYESFKTETIETIFKKYGKIIDLDVVCTRSILAFVTFETAEETQKALKELNGKTIDGLQIKIQRFYYNSSVRTVLVTNLANGKLEYSYDSMHETILISFFRVYQMSMKSYWKQLSLILEKLRTSRYLDTRRWLNSPPTRDSANRS